MPAPTTNKLSALDKVRVKALIAKLDGRGWSQFMIRDELKARLGIEISQPMVGVYRKQVWAEAVEEGKQNKAEALATKVDQLREVRREAWLAYDRSMDDAHKVVKEFANTTEQVSPDDYVTSQQLVKRIVTREGRLPDNQYLRTVLETLKQERELLGLDPEPAATTQVSVVVAGADFWRGLASQVAASLPEAVEGRVVRAVEHVEVEDAGAGENG